MGQFQPGIPYSAGQQSGGADGTGYDRQQPVERSVAQARDYTRYDGNIGQAVLFGPLEPASLLFARVMGVEGSAAFLYIGQGDLNSVISAANFETSTVSGIIDEASWARPGLPIYDQWGVAVFWDRPLIWGQGIAKIYTQQVSK